MPERKAQQGHSILEAVISLSLFLVLMTIVMSVYSPSRLLHARGERQTDVQQNARLAMAEMSRIVRMVGYFPENFATVGGNAVQSDPVLVATEQALAIHGDADGTGTSNAFMFCLDRGRLRRTRDLMTASSAYNCANGEVLAENVVGLRFTYYDETGTTIPDPLTSTYALDDQSPGAVPATDDTTQRGAVRRVVITLSLESESVRGKSQEFHLTSDIFLRNVG